MDILNPEKKIYTLVIEDVIEHIAFLFWLNLMHCLHVNKTFISNNSNYASKVTCLHKI